MSNLDIIPLKSGEISAFSDTEHAYQKENMIGASNDLEAVYEWVRRSANNSKNTEISYIREAKRLMVYCYVINKQFADLKSHDINNFYDLLENPTEDWLIPKEAHKQPDYVLKPTQLLKGKLSKTSLAQTHAILKSMFNYLNDAGYVRGNCISLARKIKKSRTQDEFKALSLSAWNYFEIHLQNRIANAPNIVEEIKAHRDKWLIQLMFHTGMRRSSIISSTMSCIFPKEIGGVRHLHIQFLMKGNKYHTVLLSDEVIEHLKEYRKYLGLPELPLSTETDVPLVHSLNHIKKNLLEPKIKMLKGDGISTDGLNVALKYLKNNARDECDDEWIAKELDEMTPHTLRHTCATHRLINGASIESTQETLGHSSIQTTMIYSHMQDEILLSEQQKITERRQSRKS
jgi:integrase